MEWTINEPGNKQSPPHNYELNKIIPEVTKRVVAAVDLTLARFVERLVPLEHSVTRLLENKTTEAERNIQSENTQENTRRGKKRRAEEIASPIPLPPLFNKEIQIGRNRMQPIPVDAGVPEIRRKRNILQNEERSIRSGYLRTREPNAIIVVKIKEESEISY